MGRRGIALDLPEGRVHLDTATMEGRDRFEGVGVALDLATVAEAHTALDLGDVTVPVPERTRLLLMKLKAAWDRAWRLDHGTSADPDREKGKLIKDLADVLALVDPSAGGREVDHILLGTMLERHPFLAGTLRRAGQDRSGVGFYGRMGADRAGEAVEGLLRLAGLV